MRWSGAQRPVGGGRAYSVPTMPRFEFRFSRGYERFARAFGVTPERAWAAVEAEPFEPRYGP